MNWLRMARTTATVMLLAASASAAGQALRDPTRPPGRAAKAQAEAPSSGFVLQSILNSPERKAAVINGKVVGPGESVDGFMLVGITENEAVLKNGSDVRRLRLYPSVAVKKSREQPEGAAGTGSVDGK